MYCWTAGHRKVGDPSDPVTCLFMDLDSKYIFRSNVSTQNASSGSAGGHRAEIESRCTAAAPLNLYVRVVAKMHEAKSADTWGAIVFLFRS